MYVVSNPQYGFVQYKSSGNAVSRCTESELRANDVVYQHFGFAKFSDKFTVAFSTTPYDLTSNQLDVDITIRPLPTLKFDKASYVYYNTCNAALQGTYNVSTSEIGVTGNGAYIHILNTSNVTFNVSSNLIGSYVCSFKLNGSILRGSSGVRRYPELGFNYSLNNVSGNYVNQLASYGLYKDIFVFHHTAFLNHHVDCNIVSPNAPFAPAYDDRTSIVYPFDPNTTTILDTSTHTLEISVNIWPQSSIGSSSVSQLPGLDNQKFNLEVTMLNSDYVHFTFTKFTYTVKYNYGVAETTVKGQLPFQLNESAFNQITIKNYDPSNRNSSGYYCLSLYWKDGVTNLIYGSNIPSFDAKNLAFFAITVPTTSSNNYIASSNFVGSVQGDANMYASYDMYNTYTKYLMKDLQINVTIYDIIDNISLASNTVNNLIMGNSVTVYGTNNICIGNNLNTSGTNSIIIGNKIGDVNANNIYESIIIGNTSFQNSFVRDIICIGRNNLAGLSELNGENGLKVQNFLGQKPIVIGNNINSNMIDYNINIGNTFPKTANNTNTSNNVAIQQIYIGNSAEVVGIGYSANVSLPNTHSLHVNGGISASYITATNAIMCAYVGGDSIDVGYLVSATGWFVGDLPRIVRSGGSNREDTKVIGVCLGKLEGGTYLVGTRGKLQVWCSGNVSCGQFMKASLTVGGVATASSSTTLTNSVFAKSLTTLNDVTGTNSNLITCLM